MDLDIALGVAAVTPSAAKAVEYLVKREKRYGTIMSTSTGTGGVKVSGKDDDKDNDAYNFSSEKEREHRATEAHLIQVFSNLDFSQL